MLSIILAQNILAQKQKIAQLEKKQEELIKALEEAYACIEVDFDRLSEENVINNKDTEGINEVLDMIDKVLM